jgi:hypothetical protein
MHLLKRRQDLSKSAISLYSVIPTMKASFIFLKGTKLVSSKGKRWNGNVDALPVTYLKDVMAKMLDYGDRVHFSLISGGALPSYQIINPLDKKMAFDRDHHLLQPQTDEFVGANASQIFSLDQIKARIAGVSLRPAPLPGLRGS